MVNLVHATFAGLSWSFRADDDSMQDLVRAGVPLGETKAKAAIRARVRHRSLRPGSDELVGHMRAECAWLRRADFWAAIDLDRSVVDVAYHHPPALQSALRIAAGLLLASRGGLLLHASAVVSGERAFVFPGPSGAGKTTIATLAGHRRVLSDEISAVTPNGAGFRAEFTPFWGDLACRRSFAAGAPLAALFFPAADTTVAVERLPPARALTRLLPCVFRCVGDGHLERRLLAAAARVVEQVPCFVLRFRRDETFWRQVDA